jgi:hypothetical protein
MVAVLTGGLLTLTGCGGPGDAQTLQVFDAGVGVNDRSSDVYVLNALVVDNSDATGTLSVSLLDKSGDGDQLVGVEASSNTGEPIEVQQHVQPLELCGGELEPLGPDAEVMLSGEAVAAGGTITVTFTFRDAEPVRATVPVVGRLEGSDLYESVAETPPAVAEPTDCASASPTPSA